MDRPVTVYLDSQDISRLSLPEGECRPILADLRGLRDAGKARFPFSDVHIFENLPTSPEHAHEGLARIELLAELSQGQNLPSSDRIVEHELRTLWAARLRRTYPPLVCGHWFPEVDIPLMRPDRRREALKAEVKESYQMLTRVQRRQLVKAAASRQGRTLDASVNDAVDELLDRYPLRLEDRSTFAGYFTGAFPVHEVLQCIHSGIQDVALFARWISNHWEQGRQFVELLRSPARRFHQSMTAYFDSMQSLIKEMPPQLYDDTMLPTLERARKQFLSEIAGRLLKSVLGITPPTNLPPGQLSPEVTPSLQVVADFLVRLSVQVAARQRARDPRNGGRGDFGDALHALYLPRVDLFRADAQSGALLIQNKATQPMKIVRRLQDLPDAIRATQEHRWMDI